MRTLTTRILTAVILLVAALASMPVPAGAAIDPGGYVIRTRSIEVESTNPGLEGGSVGCGKGRRVVTGGAYWHLGSAGPDPLLNAYLASSAPKPNGKGWFAAGINWSSDTLILEVVAYCLPKSAVGSYTVRTVDRTVDDNDFRSATPRCGNGRRAVTGGAYWLDGDGSPSTTIEGYLRSSTPLPSPNGWWANGYSDVGTHTLRAIVLCRPASAVGPYTGETRDVAIDEEESKLLTRSCGNGKRAVPGGAFWHEEGKDRNPVIEGYLRASVPWQQGRAWLAVGYSTEDIEVLMRVVVFCRPV
jgi:hypothetical protein